MASKMRTRKEVAKILADKGYGRGTFGWPKAGRLEVLHPILAKPFTFALAAGTSLKALHAALAGLPLAGLPLAGQPRPLDTSLGFTVFPHIKAIQMELEAVT